MSSAISKRPVPLSLVVGAAFAAMAMLADGIVVLAAQADKLPSQVVSRIKSIDASLAKTEQSISNLPQIGAQTRLANAQTAVDNATATLNEALQKYPKVSPDHPDIKAARERIAATDAKVKEAAKKFEAGKAGAEQNKAATKALSDEWVVKLSPYAASNPGQKGYDKDKQFVAGATDNVEEMQHRLKVYNELSPLFAEYKKVEFPGGKSSDLEQIERSLEHGLKTFAEEFKSRIAQRLAEVDGQLDHAARFLKEQKAKIGGKEKPLPLQKEMLPDMMKQVDAIAAVAPKDDPNLAAVREKLSAVQSLSAEVRGAFVDQTIVSPDKYTGADLPALKTKAEQIVLAKFADAKILRVTVTSGDWKEEKVIEPTDTTNTALRLRITRSVTAQVAAKRGDEVKLHTLDISKDRRTDGTFGDFYGHIMFTDVMLEKNVNAAAP